MKYRHGTGLVTPAGRQMSSETSGAPAGPGTSRSATSNAPPRRMSSTVGTGNIDGARRIAGIISSVNGGPAVCAMGVIAGCSSRSNGTGGPIGTAPGVVGSSAVSIPATTASSSAAGLTAGAQQGSHDEISYLRTRSICSANEPAGFAVGRARALLAVIRWRDPVGYAIDRSGHLSPTPATAPIRVAGAADGSRLVSLA